MSVTQRLMKPGTFRLDLVDNYPQKIARDVDFFDHIVITRNRLEPIAGYTDANILANAIYTGVITSRPNRRTFAGADLSYWLGTPNGLGDLLDTAVSRTTGTLAQWIGDLLPPALTAGTVTNTGITLTNTYQWVTRREAIDAMCRSVGAEYKVNPDGTVDAAVFSPLFGYTTPRVVITRKKEGTDGPVLRGLEATQLVTSGDVEQYTTKVIVVAQGQGTSASTGSSTGSTSYVDFGNNTLVMERLVNAPTEPSANATTVAAATVAKFNSVRTQLALSSKTYTVTRFVTPGDYVWAYDPEQGLSLDVNQVIYQGELITPIGLRVYSLTWPIEQGVGVYARASGATPTYTDLTDWVKWETGDVTWEVGAASRPLSDDSASEGSVAYLGANPGVAERTSDAANAWIAPTLLNSWVNFGGSDRTARYRKVGDKVQIEGTIKSGVLTSAAFTLPAGYRPPQQITAAQASNGAFGDMLIDTSGNVIPYAGSNVWFTIHCEFSTST